MGTSPRIQSVGSRSKSSLKYVIILPTNYDASQDWKRTIPCTCDMANGDENYGAWPDGKNALEEHGARLYLYILPKLVAISRIILRPSLVDMIAISRNSCDTGSE